MQEFKPMAPTPEWPAGTVQFDPGHLGPEEVEIKSISLWTLPL